MRELALRELADNVEEDGIESNQKNYCNVRERVLVCVSTYPNSLQLMRRGSRIAGYVNAKLYGLYVDNPNKFISREESLHIETCIRLCRDFGGEFLQIKSTDTIGTIIDVAKQQRITQVVLGETRRSRWENFIKGSIVQKLVGSLLEVDIHIIANERSARNGTNGRLGFLSSTQHPELILHSASRYNLVKAWLNRWLDRYP